MINKDKIINGTEINTNDNFENSLKKYESSSDKQKFLSDKQELLNAKSTLDKVCLEARVFCQHMLEIIEILDFIAIAPMSKVADDSIVELSNLLVEMETFDNASDVYSFVKTAIESPEECALIQSDTVELKNYIERYITLLDNTDTEINKPLIGICWSLINGTITKLLLQTTIFDNFPKCKSRVCRELMNDNNK